MNPSRLLLGELGPDGRPLFASPSELGRAITQSPKYRKLYGGSKERSLKSFLAQILRGTRRCPSELVKAITWAVETRLSDADLEVRREWSRKVREALLVEGPTGTSRPLSSKEQFENLLILAESAAEHFIITAMPAESVSSLRAEKLTDILVRRLGLDNRAEEEALSPTEYSFHFPSYEHCISWWRHLARRLHSSLRAASVANGVERQLVKLDEEDRIRVFEVPREVCGCPVVVFDPESSQPNGFNLYYHAGGLRDDVVSVSSMDEEYIKRWHDYVFWPLKYNELESRRVMAAEALLRRTEDGGS